MEEFVPFDHLKKLFSYWWILVLTGLAGAVIGFIYHELKPPIYESSAMIEASLDFNAIGITPLTQYDEDLALSNIEGAMRAAATLDRVVSQAQAQGIQFTPDVLLYNVIIERKHAFWELRFHSADPQIARTITEIWAAEAYNTLIEWQTTGFLPAYVVFYQPSPVEATEGPAAYNRNKLVMSGAVVGFLIGILLVESIKAPIRRTVLG